MSTYVYCPSEGTEILVLGDSFVTAGINPGIVEHLDNIGQAGESWVISYFKLKRIILNNDSQISKIIIPFSPLYFSKTYDDIFSNDKISREMYGRIYSLVELSDLSVFEQNSPNYLRAFFRYKLFPNFQYMSSFIFEEFLNKKGNYPYVGKFGVPYNPPPVEYNYEAEVENIFLSDGAGVNLYGQNNLSYLDSIAQFSVEHDLAVYMVEFPVHKGFYEVLPAVILNHCDSVKNRITQRYSNFEYLNYSTEFDDVKYFHNITHLSLKGANEISRRINSEINGNNLN